MTGKRWAVMALAALAIVLGAGLYLQNDAKTDFYRAKAASLDRFCRMTRISLQTTARALETGSAKEQAFHADLVFREAIHRGYSSVQTCLGDATPPTPDGWSFCRINDDYACIAQQMRVYLDALMKGGW